MAGPGSVAELRNRARAAARKAAGSAQKAQSIAGRVSADRDLEGDVQRCANDAAAAAQRARQAAQRTDNATALPPYADREEKRDAVTDGRRHCAAAELAADEAENAAAGAEWAAQQIESADREVATSTGASWQTTYRGWSRRRR